MITDEDTQAICARIVAARKKAGLTQRQTVDRLSEHYAYTLGSYRCLEARAKPHNLGNPHYHVKINKLLIKALSTALGTTTDDLAPEPLYGSLPDRARYRTRNAPKASDADPHAVYVRNPRRTAERLQAFMIQYGYNPRSFSQALRFHGYAQSESQLRAILRGDRAHLITHSMLDSAVSLFDTFHLRDNKPPFDKNRLLLCLDNCPHCNEWLRNA